MQNVSWDRCQTVGIVILHDIVAAPKRAASLAGTQAVSEPRKILDCRLYHHLGTGLPKCMVIARLVRLQRWIRDWCPRHWGGMSFFDDYSTHWNNIQSYLPAVSWTIWSKTTILGYDVVMNPNVEHGICDVATDDTTIYRNNIIDFVW